MEKESINWDKIKAEFISSSTLKSLAIKYSVPLATIKSRHAREHWSEQRKELKKKTEGKVQEKIAEEKATNTFNAVELIDNTLNKLTEALPEAQPMSLESVARAMNDLLKTRGLYTGETSPNKQPTGLSVNADDVIRETIEWLDAKQAGKPVEFEDLALPPDFVKY